MTDIVWPKNADGTPFVDKIRLDKTSVLDYLDEPPALPLRHKVAEIFNKHNCKTVVDVGCGVGRINDFIDAERYMGFDDDIKLVGKGHRKYRKTDRNIDMREASWRQLDKIKVDFEVDCLMLLGVLSYAMPEFDEVYEKNGFHKEMFHNLVDLYNPRVIIIQEILQDQTNVADTNELKVLPLDYYMTFDPEYHELDLPIWCGHRAILDINGENVYKA